MVHATKKRGVNSLMYAPKIETDVEKLTQHLRLVAHVHGEFKIEDAARKFHHEWYNDFSKNHREDSTGVYERIHDGMLKVAMLLSLSDRLDLVVEEKHIKEATEKCLRSISGSQIVTAGSGRSETSEKTRVVLKYLIRRPNHSASRKQLLSYGHGEFDAIDLDRIVESLTQTGWLSAVGNGGNINYTLSGVAVELYDKFTKGE